MNSPNTVSLGEIAVFVNGDRGKNYPRKTDFVDSGIPFINAGHLSNGKVRFSKMNFISEESFQKLGSGKVTHGDILYCLRGSLGKTAMWEEHNNAAIASSLVIIRPISECFPRYLLRFLRSPVGKRQITRFDNGSSQPNLSASSVKKYQIPLPPLTEQKRIAKILDAADALRTQRREAIAQLDALVQSTFLEMFGDPVQNPKAWPTTKLSECGEVQGGLQVTSARKKLPLERPYLRVANVFRGFLKLSEIKTIRLKEAEYFRTELKKDDLLIVEGHGNPQEIGRCAIWDGSIENCVHQNHIIRLRLNGSQVLPSFCSNFLNSEGGRRFLVRSGRTTSGLNTISVSKVRSTPALAPPLELQQQFAQIVESIENQKTKHQLHLAQLDDLFACLQQRAFNGEL